MSSWSRREGGGGRDREHAKRDSAQSRVVGWWTLREGSLEGRGSGGTGLEVGGPLLKMVRSRDVEALQGMLLMGC